MQDSGFVSRDEIRAQFSCAMSDMYQTEVPLYGALLELVAETNNELLRTSPSIREHMTKTGEIHRLSMERHGAIRVGTVEELATIRRLFAVMGMQPVGYYDLGPAGVPVHSTAFRAVHEDSLQASPFRVFTSLLRLELIDNPDLQRLAKSILAKRSIFTPGALELIARAERDGGLTKADATSFINEALETFRWHTHATVTANEYTKLHDQHRLIADVVAFKGPHINHLTPRTLDIDKVQAEMAARGMSPKAVVEGPPRRQCPILLRQTSFKALEEHVAFADQDSPEGRHTARFGEIEQRGAALTPKGRALYDKLLNAARAQLGEAPSEGNAVRYAALLAEQFEAFPDSLDELHHQQLAYFRYLPTEQGLAARHVERASSLQALIDAGHVSYEPLVYEDFLPVSAAGIFQSNLGDNGSARCNSTGSQAELEAALGVPVLDEMKLYESSQARSIDRCMEFFSPGSIHAH
ncbi:2-oxoadipate dioxygenase/decarboxylase HglS [Pseudomonas sp. SST3]|uniref:2-oxoadipate dioxygenase/decarboxylase HglS n=1 Tax=Pseudomonas sp. SST3 TaxID=2267882 RepID=UPI000E06C0BB|nr:VOC family protein [Pseudomonas sp. SST3]NKQ11296.1 VOC family protein [Pseudomonas sp. SST3]